MAGINYLVNRLNTLNTYLISAEGKEKGSHKIEHILKAKNYYQIKITDLAQNHPQYQLSNPEQNITKNSSPKKGDTFTYVRKETRYFTKLFKNHNIKIAFQMKNTLEKHLCHNKLIANIYDKSGVYRLKCHDCPGNYVGQTSRSFKIRYNEHLQAIRSNNAKSGYAQHILNTQHSFGNLEDTVHVLNTQHKGPYLNTLEKYHIYKTNRTGCLLHDIYSDTYNPIFELLI
jgi:hypothetical protein